MPGEVKRKIMKHGTSGVVAIPIAYRRYFNLNPGETVKILYDSLLLIIPERLEHILKEKRQLIDELLGQTCGSRLETKLESAYSNES